MLGFSRLFQPGWVEASLRALRAPYCFLASRPVGAEPPPPPVPLQRGRATAGGRAMQPRRGERARRAESRAPSGGRGSHPAALPAAAALPVPPRRRRRQH